MQRPSHELVHLPVHIRAASTSTAEDKVVSFEEVPGPSDPRFLEQLQEIDQLTLYRNLYKDYGSPVAKYMGGGGQYEVALFDPDDIRQVYAKEGRYPNTITAEVWALRKYFMQRGEALNSQVVMGFQQGGEEWRKARDKIGTGLMVKEAAKYLPLINDAAKHAVSFAPKYSEDIAQWLTRAAFDMFTSVAIGVNPKSCDPHSDSPLTGMIDYGEQGFKNAVELWWMTWLTEEEQAAKYKLVEDNFDEVTRITDDFLEAFVSDENGPDCWFKHLKYERGIAQTEIAAIMPSLLAAGIGECRSAYTCSKVSRFCASPGTTSGVMQWNVMNLANHPEKQQILREEIQSVLKGEPFSKEADLPYLKAWIRESHRFTPPGGMMTMRKLDVDLTTPSGYFIPAGTRIVITPYPSFFDEAKVEKPDEFQPERFLPQSVAERKEAGGSVIDSGISKHPFSMGPRACLGRRAAELEIQALLVNLVSNYEIIATPLFQDYRMILETTAFPKPFPKVSLKPVAP